MKKYLISGIGPGSTGVGRLMNQLIIESNKHKYTNIYNFASQSVRRLLEDKKYRQFIVEVALRVINSIVFHLKINRINGSEVILIYPQGIGLKSFKKLIINNKVVKIYIMDNSFFCMKSYNYLNGECLKCVDDFRNYDASCSPLPRPFRVKDYTEFIEFLKSHIMNVKLFVQSESHKLLLQRVYGQEVAVTVIGMNTGEFDFTQKIKIKKPRKKKTIVFHNHLIDSKGFQFALDLAIKLEQYDFIFPSRKPKNVQCYENVQYLDITWDSRLKELVMEADLILCLSMWSTPIEGALVKSVYYNGNVAVMDNQFGFNTEIPNNAVLKLKYDLSIAMKQIDDFMQNTDLDYSDYSMKWLKKTYANYDVSKLFA